MKVTVQTIDKRSIGTVYPRLQLASQAAERGSIPEGLSSAKLFWVMYFVTVALPLHSSNNFLSWVTIAGNITVFHIVAVLILGICILEGINRLKYMKISLSGVLSFLLIAATCIALIIGRSNGLSNDINDAAYYVFALCILLINQSKGMSHASLIDFFDITAWAITVNCCINVLMNVTEWQIWGLEAFNTDSRIGGGYYNILCICVPFCLFLAIEKRRAQNWARFVLIVLLFLICSMYAKSRVTVIAVVALLALTTLVEMVQTKSKGFAYNLLIGIVFLVIGFFAISLFAISDSDLANRLFNSSYSVSDTSDTLYTRIATFEYYYPQILANPFGHGMGYQLIYLSRPGVFDYDTIGFVVDNALITAGMKLGVLGTIAYAGLIVVSIYNVIRDNGPLHYRLLFASYMVMFFFVVGMLTSQMIHNYPVIAVSWTFVGLMVSNFGKIGTIVSLDERSIASSNRVHINLDE